ncbi:hypothetical protein DV702_05995 [Sporosarcina sp. PTS2304]|uniref:hypothetical protein n=1 Tax=Sporosarcina sp. PTS2304 TaxID=2283194 RepID=UPI000E0D7E46|nr:hypothetical protein [Sporosarcina sp. PTS2304]AXH99332.1 hypothetical protein DV702_05995 [Sporosarcina sp. PTS2304]
MFSNEQLSALIQGEIIGRGYPYNTQDETEIESHIRRLFHRIERIPNVMCEAEWNHFGSGYASFIEFFCYRKEDRVIVEEHGIQHITIDGIMIDISRLAPVAIFGEDERVKKVRVETAEEVSSGHGTILDGTHRLKVSKKLQPLANDVSKALNEYDYQLLASKDMMQPLPFQANIPTVYRPARQYIVMDAIFYWED